MRFRDFAGMVHTIQFSGVDRVSNMSKDFSYAVFNASVIYTSDIDKVTATLWALNDELRAGPEFQARIMTRPLQQWAVMR